MKRIINSHKSIIFLDGDFPDPSIFDFINLNAVLIAADGAAEKMEKEHLTPAYIIGDLDSVSKTKHTGKIIESADQDTTDFEKCLQFVLEKELFPTLVLGINGKELDHIIGNLQIFLRYSKKMPLYFLDSYEKERATGIKLGAPISKNHSFHLEKGITASIIHFERILISSKGFHWELEDNYLHFDQLLSLRNITKEKELRIFIKEGQGILILDVTKSIKKFCKKLIN